MIPAVYNDNGSRLRLHDKLITTYIRVFPFYRLIGVLGSGECNERARESSTDQSLFINRSTRATRSVGRG